MCFDKFFILKQIQKIKFNMQIGISQLIFSRIYYHQDFIFKLGF